MTLKCVFLPHPELLDWVSLVEDESWVSRKNATIQTIKRNLMLNIYKLCSLWTIRRGSYLCRTRCSLVPSGVNKRQHDSVCVERRRGTSVTHQRAPVCKLRGRPTVGRSITTVDRTLISRGISSYSRSRTNKLSPNIGFAWQWGSLWVCVWGGGGGGGGWGHAYIKQRRSVNIGVWRINTLFFLKERLMLKHHSASLPGPSVSRGPDRHFSFVALAGKDGAQIKISLSEVKYLCIQNKAVCNFQTGGERGNESARGGGGRRRNMHLHQRRGRQNTFRKLAFLK